MLYDRFLGEMSNLQRYGYQWNLLEKIRGLAIKGYFII